MKLFALNALVVILTVFSVKYVQGLFFFLEGGQSKCFVEDLPKDMMAVGKSKKPTELHP